MARSAVLAIRILADGSQSRREMDRTGRAAEGMGGRMKSASKGAAVLLGGLALGASAAGRAASDLQQSTGAVQSIYGRYAASIIRNSKAAAQAVGLSQSAYQNQAVLLGSQLKNLGLPMDQVAGQTDNLIRKASDLAATFGGSTSDAVEAIGSLMRGERDPIERYGVSINDAALKAYILQHHLANTTAEQQKNAKRTATLALLYKQTSAATGQFARETKSAAGAQEIANAKLENAKAALGQRLLPVMAKFKSILGSTASFVARNSKVVFILAGVVGGLAAAVLIVNGAVRAYMAITRAMIAVQAAWNAIMAANPVFLIVAGLVALGVALVVAYQKSQTFRDIVKGAFEAVQTIVRSVATFFTDTLPKAFLEVGRGLHRAWDAAVAFLRTWGGRAQSALAAFIGIPGVIARHFRQLVGWLGGVWSTVYGGARRFVGNVVDAVTGIPGRLTRSLSHWLNAGKQMVGAMFRGIAGAVSAAGGWAGDIAHMIVNSIIRGINSVLDLPWVIKVTIPIPMAPDVHFGPYQLLGRIPLWGADYTPSLPVPPSLADLQPGFPLQAARAMPGWPADLSPSGGGIGFGGTVIDRRSIRVEFPGLVTDPEGVARQLRKVLDDSDHRNGLARGRN